MQRLLVGIEHRFVHHLRQRRMREDGVRRALRRSASPVLAIDIALDQFGDFGADHVRAQQFAGVGIEHGLDQAFGLAQRDRLAVADEGKVADLDLAARSPWPWLRSGRRLATCGQQ